MKYELLSNKILIYSSTDFNACHILECGQIFRYKKLSKDNYVVFSLDKKAEIFKTDFGYEIITNDVAYFSNFFDLNTNYTQIKLQLAFNEIMQTATQFGSGIRILKQNVFEMLISFIISANNRIPNIQNIIEKLCKKCGTNMGDYYAFPTYNQLLTLSEDDLKLLSLGFRAKYIYNTLRLVTVQQLENAKNMTTEQLLYFLQTLSGVGPKVADCIALFGYGKQDCFPVDVWIEKVYNCYFSEKKETNRNKIRKKFIEIFGMNSGYAQQYLFYYKREMDSLKLLKK